MKWEIEQQLKDFKKAINYFDGFSEGDNITIAADFIDNVEALDYMLKAIQEREKRIIYRLCEVSVDDDGGICLEEDIEMFETITKATKYIRENGIKENEKLFEVSVDEFENELDYKEVIV